MGIAGSASPSTKDFRTFQRDWLRTLRDGGYAAPHWVKEWGGGGYSLAEQIVIFEEFSRLNAPPLRNYFVALNHAYATLMHAGNRRAAAAAPAGDPRRRGVVSGLLRARGRVRSRQPANPSGSQGRRLRGQRSEGVVEPRGVRGSLSAAGPHRSGRAQAARHLLLPARHEIAWGGGSHHQAGDRSGGVLRSVPH